MVVNWKEKMQINLKAGEAVALQYSIEKLNSIMQIMNEKNMDLDIGFEDSTKGNRFNLRVLSEPTCEHYKGPDEELKSAVRHFVERRISILKEKINILRKEL